jgi:hypothetical protein
MVNKRELAFVAHVHGVAVHSFQHSAAIQEAFPMAGQQWKYRRHQRGKKETS